MSDAAQPRVLVIDDSETVRWVLCEALRMSGLAAEESESGADALQKVEHRTYELVLTDLVLPDMSGWAVVDAIHARHSRAEVIVMTGQATTTELEAAEARNVRLAVKPLALADLRGIVQAAIEHRPIED